MVNPFENEAGTYFVLINDKGQYSLWPSFLEVPPGWTVIYGQESRQKCLDYINSHWKDMKPTSLSSW
ncbi:MAG: MbtH family protein [Thermoactinomyces sp.]